MVRSIGRRTGAREREEVGVSDAMDVLAMLGPHAGASTGLLEGVARRVVGEGAAVGKREVRREEVLVLLGLVMRLRVGRERWGVVGEYYTVGAIADASPEDEEVAETVVDSLVGDESEQVVLTSEQLSRGMDLMVSSS